MYSLILHPPSLSLSLPCSLPSSLSPSFSPSLSLSLPFSLPPFLSPSLPFSLPPFLSPSLPFFLPHRDRFRTTVNVFGDCVGVGVISRLSRKQLSAGVPHQDNATPDTETAQDTADRESSMGSSIMGNSTKKSPPPPLPLSSDTHSPMLGNNRTPLHESTDL